MVITGGRVAVAHGQPLTPREVLILDGMARGHTKGEIGDRLGLKESTIRSYTRRINVKLGAKNARHAIALGFVHGYLKTGKRVTS
jgi:DNA-binding CsgD family transcriptional regulator